MRQAFETPGGTVEVVVDESSRTVSIYRFDERRRAVAATMESWDHVDLAEVLVRKIGVPSREADGIAQKVRTLHAGMSAPLPLESDGELLGKSPTEDLNPAGVALRFVALLLDAVIIVFPLSILVGLLAGGGYRERGDGYATVGVNVAGTAIWAWLGFALSYYVLCEAMTGMTLGKRIVGIRVVHGTVTSWALGRQSSATCCE